MKRVSLSGLFFILSSLIVIGISTWTRSSLSIFGEAGKSLGLALFSLGMVGFIWAVLYLRETFLGIIAPVSDRLITNGPYRWVRHPLYLSMMIMLLGLALSFRSLWGVLTTLAFFVPAVIYRAYLEERALAEKYKGAWRDYSRHTSFLIPFL